MNSVNVSFHEQCDGAVHELVWYVVYTYGGTCRCTRGVGSEGCDPLISKFAILWRVTVASKGYKQSVFCNLNSHIGA